MDISNSLEKQMKEMTKLFESRINTEDLIFEVEEQPAIWDSRTDAYSDKLERLNSWNNILKNFIPEFEEKPGSEKNVLVTIAQKKWKSIRTCYTRELQKKRNIKSGSEPTKKKTYVYFDQLRFLENMYKKTTGSVEEDDSSHVSVDTYIRVEPDKSENEKPKNKIRKIVKTEDDEVISVPKLIAVPKKKIAVEADTTEEAKKEDKHFLLSLLSEIHKVPAEKKLKLRSDIISVIAAAQAPDNNQQWPSFGGPFMLYPFQHPTQFLSPVSQYPSSSIHPPVPPQQIPPSRFSHQQTQPNKSSHQQIYLSTSPSLSTESQILDSPVQSDSEV